MTSAFGVKAPFRRRQLLQPGNNSFVALVGGSLRRLVTPVFSKQAAEEHVLSTSTVL